MGSDGAGEQGDDRRLAEAELYAQAAWQRFEHEVDDRLLRAVTGAFVLIAASDGDLAEVEAERFLDLMHGRARLFPKLDFAAVGLFYRDLTTALLSDPAGGRAQALDCVAAVRDVAAHCLLVLAAARVAVEADAAAREPELKVLEEIRVALGLAD